MNSLKNKIEKVIKKEDEKNSNSEKFNELEKLIDALEELGIKKKPAYNLPPIDTIGKSLYNSLKHRINS